MRPWFDLESGLSSVAHVLEENGAPALQQTPSLAPGVERVFWGHHTSCFV